MDCRDFEAWLDAGRPEAARVAAEAHADACPDCSALVAADAEIEVALGAALLASAPDFTARVMARVAKESRARASLPIDPELLLPWWVEILREPQALLGLAVGALCTTAGPLLVPMIRESVAALVVRAPALAGQLGAAQLPPVLIAGLALPMVAGASWALYRLASAAAARLSGAAS